MILHIKNMVCERCKMVVSELLMELSLHLVKVNLGEVEIEENPDPVTLHELNDKLKSVGFEILNGRQRQMIENIKSLAISYVRERKNFPTYQNFSVILSRTLSRDYSYLSQLFSSRENVTIEKYIILQKIERVKELLKYEELTLSQIADELGYSSVQHLSAQFKKITGLTPGYLKNRDIQRRSIDQVGKK